MPGSIFGPSSLPMVRGLSRSLCPIVLLGLGRGRNGHPEGQGEVVRRLDFEMVQLLARFLHGRNKPSGLQAAPAPCLGFVGRIAILRLELASSELAAADM